MSEKTFVDSLRQSANKIDSSSFVWKTNDMTSVGIPDLILIIRGETYAIEAKSVTGYYKKSGDQKCLSHPFSGPQVSILIQMDKAGAHAMGAIQIGPREAFLVSPYNIPPSDGNFTRDSLERYGHLVQKQDSIWRITEWPSLLSASKKNPETVSL